MSVCAIILAGGQASRMQGEKPLRILRGKTLLEHTRDLVAPLADEVLVASGTRSLPLPAGTRAVPDAPEFAGRGPLAGILAGLEATRHERALVLACDLPNLPAALLQRLLDAIGGRCRCAWCRHGGHDEPLAAALDVPAARKTVRKALASGASRVVPCWESLPHRVLQETELAEFAPLERTFANLNTLEELEREQG